MASPLDATGCRVVANAGMTQNVFGIRRARITRALLDLLEPVGVPSSVVRLVIAAYAAPTQVLYAKSPIRPRNTTDTTLTLFDVDQQCALHVWNVPCLTHVDLWKPWTTMKRPICPHTYVCPDNGDILVVTWDVQSKVMVMILIRISDAETDARLLGVCELQTPMLYPSVPRIWMLRPGSSMRKLDSTNETGRSLMMFGVGPRVVVAESGDAQEYQPKARSIPHPRDPDMAISVGTLNHLNTPEVSIDLVRIGGDAHTSHTSHTEDTDDTQWTFGLNSPSPSTATLPDDLFVRLRWCDTTAAANTPWESTGGLLYVVSVHGKPNKGSNRSPTVAFTAVRLDNGGVVGQILAPYSIANSIDHLFLHVLSNGVLCVYNSEYIGRDTEDRINRNTCVLWHPLRPDELRQLDGESLAGISQPPVEACERAAVGALVSTTYPIFRSTMSAGRWVTTETGSAERYADVAKVYDVATTGSKAHRLAQIPMKWTEFCMLAIV